MMGDGATLPYFAFPFFTCRFWQAQCEANTRKKVKSTSRLTGDVRASNTSSWSRTFWDHTFLKVLIF